MRTAEAEEARYAWVTTTEAARRIGCSRRHALRLIERGELKARDVSDPEARRHGWRVDPASVAAFMRRRERAA